MWPCSHHFNPRVNPLCGLWHLLCPGPLWPKGVGAVCWRLIRWVDRLPDKMSSTKSSRTSVSNFLPPKQNVCESGEVSSVRQMWSDGEGVRMWTESQAAVPGSDFRLKRERFFPDPATVSLSEHTLLTGTVRLRQTKLVQQGHRQRYRHCLVLL